MASKLDLLAGLKPVPHIVTFRFPSPDMEARFKFQPNGTARRGREQAQHDMCEFWRNEVLAPAVRFCWRAQQPEYLTAGGPPALYWKLAGRHCKTAAKECWAYFDGGFVTVQMGIWASTLSLSARADLTKLRDALVSALGWELGLIENDAVRYGTDGAPRDRYEAWRERVYRDIQRSLSDDLFNGEVSLIIQPRSEAQILGRVSDEPDFSDDDE